VLEKRERDQNVYYPFKGSLGKGHRVTAAVPVDANGMQSCSKTNPPDPVLLH